MKIILATFATPTYTSELYEHTLVDLAEMYEVRAFMDHEQAIIWAQGEIATRNAELKAEHEEHGEDLVQFQLYDDRSPQPGRREILWTEDGDVENTTPDQTYVLLMKDQDLNAE